jgi:hypothetical protein
MNFRTKRQQNIADASIDEMDVVVEQSTVIPAEVNAALKCIARALGRMAAREYLAFQNFETPQPGSTARIPPAGERKP